MVLDFQSRRKCDSMTIACPMLFFLFDVDVVKYGFKYGSRDEAERDGSDHEERSIIRAKAKA